MQKELSKGPLLNLDGSLNESGYALEPVKDYSRDMIKVKGLRIKEWDYYYIGNDTYGVAVTIADNDYLWLTSVTFFDFKAPKEETYTKIGWFPHGKLKLPKSSLKGDIKLAYQGASFSIEVKGKKRIIKVHLDQFKKHTPLDLELTLYPELKDSMVIATPFKKKKHFYYNQKINCLKGSGALKIGSNLYDMTDTLGVLDWGRGVWTYKNTWYWSSLSGLSKDKKYLGFNLGYGFGDTSQASENMLFYGDETFKLTDVVFDIPKKGKKDDFMSPWKIYSKNKDIDLTFTPILDRYSNTNIILIQSNQHQVFGQFKGTFKVNQQIVEVDNLLGFAEKVYNRW